MRNCFLAVYDLRTDKQIKFFDLSTRTVQAQERFFDKMLHAVDLDLFVVKFITPEDK